MEERKNKFQIKEREITSHLKMYKNMGGRPRKKEEEKRDKRVIICLTTSEKETLKKEALKLKIPLGIFIRNKLIE